MKNGNTGKVSRLDTALAFLPIIALVATLTIIIITMGASHVNDLGPVILLSVALLTVGIAAVRRRLEWNRLSEGIRKSASQILSAVPILACIGLIATTWMLGGIVPVMIDYGVSILNADMFLMLACAICAAVSVLLGSSWTTIATVGVAFMGIGSVLGYGDGWIAGAIISGAYFGDKVSPLSDTTVLASSSCGVDLFTHIRNLMVTSLPAMGIALVIFGIAGYNHANHPISHASEMTEGLRDIFNLSPWLMLAPVVTIAMCVMRVDSLKVLLVSALMGLVAIFTAQPAIVSMICDGGGDALSYLWGTVMMLLRGTEITTGNDMLDGLLATGGVAGMFPTILLVLAAMVFGGVLIGTGTLATITQALTSRLRGGSSLVSATAGTGLLLNSFTADQYLSIIIGSNIYRNTYARAGLEPKLLSRSIEDSVSVTSVLIPWNSCGITQSTVLGVSTLTYLPYCFFNYLSPLLTIAVACLREHIAALYRRSMSWASIHAR